MVQQPYVSFEEFNAFKKMTEERFRETENKIDVLTEIMISNFDRAYEQSNRKFEELTDIMMQGFERADQKNVGLQAEMNYRFEVVDKKLESIDEKFEAVDRKFELMEEKFNLRFDALDEKFERKFLENDEKLENLTDLMLDGFDMLRDKIEEYKN